jgi:AraC-like DNA-binding protein
VGRLIELMAFLSREYAQASTVEAQALVRVGEVVSLLEKEFTHPWRLDELCAAARMSRSSLLVAFREATGHTPIDYLIRVRLSRAMRLLTGTERPITQIAYDVGFADSNYFARKFRQVTGHSPSAYRAAGV